LQDEDVWVDAMRDSYQQRLWDLLAEKAKDVDAFVAVSDYFGKLMKQRMRIPENKLHIVPIGIEHDDYQFRLPNINKPVIGYLSRLNDENGFEIVVDAFIKLKQNPEFKNVKFKATGGSTGDDKRFIKKQISKLKRSKLWHDVEFLDAYQGDAKKEFLSSLSLLTVPVLKGEAFGMYQLESLASGTPIVQPALGAFPEIVKNTGGGVIFEPNTADALALKLDEVLSKPVELLKMSQQGLKSVEEHYNINVQIRKMIAVYESVVK
jgi:glycosyltransferase involved in cell wall biosynthesis